MTISVNWASYQTFHNQDLLKAEKEEKKEIRALMPPADEKPKSRNWLLRLVGA